jgi:pimeloyl-ACP methyl ester carboxylesterase
MEHATLELADGRRIAYRRTEGRGPGVVFLGGFRSDMTGTKAQFLEAWARARGQAYLRFDYTGHGASSGRFEDGAVGDWTRDAGDAVSRLTEGPQVLVGSSMGGWIALLLASRLPGRIAGIVTVAAAPDFTEDSIWAGLDAAQRARLAAAGRVELTSEYAAADRGRAAPPGAADAARPAVQGAAVARHRRCGRGAGGGGAAAGAR